MLGCKLARVGAHVGAAVKSVVIDRGIENVTSRYRRGLQGILNRLP